MHRDEERASSYFEREAKASLQNSHSWYGPALGKDLLRETNNWCLLVTSGVIFAVASAANEGQMITSLAFRAGASILKEAVFIAGAKLLQALFVLLPFLSNLRGIKFAELPGYLNGGAECFLNVGENLIDCGGVPFLPLLFMVLNMAFNIALLNLMKMSSALVASLTSTSAVPISIYILSLPLPYIPRGAELSMSFIIGAVVLLMDLILYRN